MTKTWRGVRKKKKNEQVNKRMFLMLFNTKENALA